ncbi:hypothetical protein HHK36_000891 [Tetracentron sinense]|uniref:Uncharacterized protein n=1 Tax=Tetracentron sinense TaxID=13715 RepID=A0A834ZRU9_TETSI|nr:hypothetical protein HHK36_000891 [Tetracentron sinense]
MDFYYFQASFFVSVCAVGKPTKQRLVMNPGSIPQLFWHSPLPSGYLHQGFGITTCGSHVCNVHQRLLRPFTVAQSHFIYAEILDFLQDDGILQYLKCLFPQEWL